MPKVAIQCLGCGGMFEVIPARVKTAKFCSRACGGKWRSENWIGSNHPSYRGGNVTKACLHCGGSFSIVPAKAQSAKFCSKPCADIGGFRYSGKDHPNYKEDKLPRKREKAHDKWAQAVISRDKATCQHCGASGVEMHAHHVLSFKDHPELRFDIGNGLTLCAPCHWNVHSAKDEKAVNSVKPRSTIEKMVEGNTEPSFHGNVVEGVTTRGRAYRRWEGPCDWCGKFLSKRASNASASEHHFCSKHCSGKYMAATRTYRRWTNPEWPKAVISSTSPAPEREDIV